MTLLFSPFSRFTHPFRHPSHTLSPFSYMFVLSHHRRFLERRRRLQRRLCRSTNSSVQQWICSEKALRKRNSHLIKRHRSTRITARELALRNVPFCRKSHCRNNEFSLLVYAYFLFLFVCLCVVYYFVFEKNLFFMLL